MLRRDQPTYQLSKTRCRLKISQGQIQFNFVQQISHPKVLDSHQSSDSSKAIDDKLLHLYCFISFLWFLFFSLCFLQKNLVHKTLINREYFFRNYFLTFKENQRKSHSKIMNYYWSKNDKRGQKIIPLNFIQNLSSGFIFINDIYNSLMASKSELKRKYDKSKTFKK